MTRTVQSKGDVPKDPLISPNIPYYPLITIYVHRYRFGHQRHQNHFAER